MAKKAKTAAERRHHERVAQIPCVLCELLDMGRAQSEVHHLREEQGTSQRASHWLVAALCPSCHRGPIGVHGDKTLLRIAKVSELDLLALTIERLQEAA